MSTLGPRRRATANSDGYRCSACRPRKNRCFKCRVRRAAVVRDRLTRYRAKKLCVGCGRKAKAGYTRCVDCMADNAARSKAAHAAARREGRK